jgi:hypothetical protein
LDNRKQVAYGEAMKTTTSHSVKNIIAAEMAQYGITVARLARYARATYGISRARVDQAVNGEAGWLGQWNQQAIRDWIEMVRGAWQA